MKAYHRLLKKVLREGYTHENRTDTDTLAVHGGQFRHDMSRGFPLVTTKKMWFRGIAEEFVWMYCKGSTDVNELHEDVQHIWEPWANDNGMLGPIYGEQMRGIRGLGPQNNDQIYQLFDMLIRSPESRRVVLSTWPTRPHELHDMELPPCHGIAQQFMTRGDKLDLHMYQRSCDLFIGGPWNIAFYGLFLELVSELTHFDPGELIISYGNLHLYRNHIDKARLQLQRAPVALPSVEFDVMNPWAEGLRDDERTYANSVQKEKAKGSAVERGFDQFNDFLYDDVSLQDYTPHSKIEAEVAV